MMTFRKHHLRDHKLPMSTAWLLNDIAEAKGKQELFTHQSPQVLKALRETALIQSAESSNRIEGVTVERERLRPLVIGKARPRDRSEQEIQGYRRALNEIHSRHEKLPVRRKGNDLASGEFATKLAGKISINTFNHAQD